MPHIIVKIASSPSEDKKTALAEALADTAIKLLGIDPATISVSIDEVARENWVGAVYKPEILEKPKTIYKKPGYDPL